MWKRELSNLKTLMPFSKWKYKQNKEKNYFRTKIIKKTIIFLRNYFTKVNSFIPVDTRRLKLFCCTWSCFTKEFTSILCNCINLCNNNCCKCYKSNLSCTDMCKCIGCQNEGESENIYWNIENWYADSYL